jgi:hypothetical protein
LHACLEPPLTSSPSLAPALRHRPRSPTDVLCCRGWQRNKQQDHAHGWRRGHRIGGGKRLAGKTAYSRGRSPIPRLGVMGREWEQAVGERRSFARALACCPASGSTPGRRSLGAWRSTARPRQRGSAHHGQGRRTSRPLNLRRRGYLRLRGRHPLMPLSVEVKKVSSWLWPHAAWCPSRTPPSSQRRGHRPAPYAMQMQMLSSFGDG